MVFGKAFYAIDYENEHDQWLIKRIRWLPVETMTPKYDRKGVIEGFTQKYSSNCGEGIKNSKANFLPEEVYFAEWVFDDVKKGVSPLMTLRLNAESENKFMALMQKQSYALTRLMTTPEVLRRQGILHLRKQRTITNL